MTPSKLALAFAAGLCVSAPALAVDLFLINTQDTSPVHDTLNPAFYTGNNPSTICLVGDSLFVAGFNNTGSPAECRVVKIETIFGARTFRALPDSVTTLPAFRNFTGMSYRPGAGLLVSFDGGAIGVAGSVRVFDIDTQLNPILLHAAPAGLSPRGAAGPSWDYGFGGLGFDYDANASIDGPVVAVLDFAGYPGSIQQKGPFGYRPTSIGFTTQVYDGTSVNGSSQAIAPVLNVLGSNGVAVSSTLWRDIDIDRDTGFVAARSDGNLVLGVRNSINGLSDLRVFQQGTPAGINGQNVQILSGFPGGDIVVYNVRPNTGAGQALEPLIKAKDLAGNDVPLTLRNPDGSTATFPTGVSHYDFSWDAANGRLAVSDFLNRAVYIFATEIPSGCDSVDFDGDGDEGTDADIEAFFAVIGGGVCPTGTCNDIDFDNDGDEGTDADIEAFFRVIGGGPCTL